MRKIKKIIAIFFLVVLICSLGIFIKQNKKHGQPIGDKNFIELSTKEIYTLPDMINGNAFTCTGMSYDQENNSLWVGNYGAASIDATNKYPSIVELNYGNFEVIRIIELPFLDCIYANIQGVAYDSENDSIWFTDSSKIYEINKNGKLLSKFAVDPYTADVPNGIALGKDGSLWVLFYKNYLVNYTKEGKMIGVVKCNYENQDQIVCDDKGNIWISAGVDYLGDKNYVIQINAISGQIITGFKVMESYAIEGIVFVDGNLLVMNDGLYHDAKLKENFICIYELK